MLCPKWLGMKGLALGTGKYLEILLMEDHVKFCREVFGYVRLFGFDVCWRRFLCCSVLLDFSLFPSPQFVPYFKYLIMHHPALFKPCLVHWLQILQ